jgi:hypothetical protein
MPVEVLGFQIEREYVCQNPVHRSGDILCSLAFQVCGCDQGSFLPALKVLNCACRFRHIFPPGNIEALNREFANNFDLSMNQV